MGFILDHIVLVVAILLYLIFMVELVVMLVLENRNPVKTMAWTVVLLFLPVIGVIFYFFFGRSTRKERLISKKSVDMLTKKSLWGFISQSSFELPAEHTSLIQLFRTLNRALPFEDNYNETYTDGYTMLHSLLREISHAQSHIHLEFFIFEDDPVGRLVRDFLIDKAKEGVEVRLLYDDVGCWDVSNHFFDEMRIAGVEVRGFLKVRFPLFTSRVNYRNHRKVAVIDGHIGFIGGMNIAERYLKPGRLGIWRDTHLMIRGRAVYGLQSNFLIDWFFVTRSLVTASKYYPEIGSCGTSLIQTVTSEPVGEWKPIMQGLLWAISNAKHYFYIQTPYFLPTESILAAMQTAALAGVDVRLMIPERADSRIPHFGTLSYVEDALKAGVKVYFYQKGFLHSKMMVSDDTLSTVGSTNMDFRSFEHNFEINSFIYDAETAIRMRAIFLQDQKDSITVSLKNWARRSSGQKVKESIIRLLSPLL